MKKKLTYLISGALAVLLMLTIFLPTGRAEAADIGLVITEIDYEKETMTIKSNAGDKLLLYSDGKQKTWECVSDMFSSAGVCVMDISWISKTKDYTLSIKGDKSEKVTTVVLPKQQTNLKAAFNYLTGTVNFTNADSGTLYWRKNNSTKWYKTGKTAAEQSEMLSTFRWLYERGTSVYFRIGQVKGTGANPGSRPSKEIKMTISKQGTEPSVVLSATAKTITAATTTEYRKSTESSWTKMSSKTLKITETAEAAFYKNGAAGRDVVLFFRTAATEKKLYSKEKEITVKAQEAAPTNVAFRFASASSLAMTISEVKAADGTVTAAAPSKSNPYEYTIVAADSTLKDTTVWTAVTSEDELSISAEKAPQGATIYVRQKCAVSGSEYRPESLAASYVVGSYPENSKAILNGAATNNVYLTEDVVTMVKTEGDVPENFAFRITIDTDMDTDVKTILCGSSVLEFKSEKSGSTLLVTITSTSKFETAVKTRNKAYPLKITLQNGETLNDAVTLTILNSASIDTAKALSVIHSNTDSSSYTFTVVPGSTLERDAAGNYIMTSVVSVTLNDKELMEKMMQEQNGNITVTLSADALQELFVMEGLTTDKAYDLTVTMSDGQKLTKGVTITLTEEAKIYGGPYKLIKSVSSELSESIILQLTYKTAGIYASSVTWNGINIMGNCSVNSDYILVEMDKNKVNKLTLTPGQTSETYSVIITLSNGAIVSTGYSMTLQP